MRQLTILLLLALTTATALASTTIHKARSTGSDYLIVFPGAAYGNRNVGMLINAPVAQTVTITPPTGAATVVQIDTPRTQRAVFGGFPIVDTPGYHAKVAVRLRSTGPLSLLGQYGTGGISGTFTPMPVGSWGEDYYAVAPPEGYNSDYKGYPAVYSVPMITIIASHAGTSVTVTPTAPTSKGYQAAVPFTVNLGNTGDAYVITTAGDPAATSHYEDPCNSDLTGTHIVSNYPVGVLVSDTHASWPCGQNDCGDYGVEWLPPMANWDSVYALTPSTPTNAGIFGDQVRMIFGHDGTTVTVDDDAGSHIFGTYAAGEFIDYPAPILSNGIVLRATQPFLPILFTRPSDVCQDAGSGADWSFSMTFTPGVHQWSDLTPFTTASGSQSVGNILFRYADRQLLRLNGTPLSTLFPVVGQLPDGYAMVRATFAADAYFELTGDNGATAGGVIFGRGSAPFEVGGDERVMDSVRPMVIKSFAHPIGGDMLPANPDTTPPHVNVVYYASGAWDCTVMDDEINPPATGLYDVSLVQWLLNDTAVNMRFANPLAYGYGDSRTTCTIEVVNPLLPAHTTLHVRDGAGNEFDTVLVYVPQDIEIRPQLVDVGALREGDSTTAPVTIINHSSAPFTVLSYRLRYGWSHHWSVLSPPSPAQRFTITPHDSAKILFQYHAPFAMEGEIDNDTLYITTTREFAVAALIGRNKKPIILTTACFNFGGASFDTLGLPGETRTSGSAVWVTNFGGAPLTITQVSIIGDPAITDSGFPQTDFAIIRTFDRTGTTTQLPTLTTPWIIAPGDSMFVDVAAHPHHSGVRDAQLLYDNDANGVLRDSTCMLVTGDIPSRIEQRDTPLEPTLAENYPNPAQSSTTIVLPRTGTYRVHIANMLGEEIAVLRGHDARTLSWSTAAVTRGVYRYVVIDEARGVAVARGSVVVR